MKLPIQIPPDAFKLLLCLLGALFGVVLGFMFMLSLRGVAIPPEFGKILMVLGTILGALIMGPKPKDENEDADQSLDTPSGD